MPCQCEFGHRFRENWAKKKNRKNNEIKISIKNFVNQFRFLTVCRYLFEQQDSLVLSRAVNAETKPGFGFL